MTYKLDEIINKIICGDATDILKKIPNNSIDLIITSPPYYKQRNYGKVGIGNENSVEEYIENLMTIFKECIRIIKDTGTIVFNLGDKYKNGSLLLIPYRFALEALKRENIILINEVAWIKLNPTPKQDKKKLVPSKEPFFIFAKSKNYYFNKEEFLNSSPNPHKRNKNKNSKKTNSNIGKKYFELIENSNLTEEEKKKAKLELEKAIEEVKTGKIQSFRMKIRGIHAMPYGGQNGGRKTQIEKNGFTIIKIHGNPIKKDIIESPVETIKGNIHPAVYPEFIIQELIKLLTKEGDIILDPFIGSGTTAVAAKKTNRKFIGIEINPKYCKYAEERISKTKQSPITEKNIQIY
jgi:site-specific DNA-methyltransferase (adenine-specific)